MRQLHNAKATKQEEIRLTRDAIYNTHESAYEGGFIHFLATYPDLCVVAGDVEMVQELNTVIHLRDEDLLLSYDTTFNFGEKRNSVFLYHCSVFSYPSFVFCTTVPFFPQLNKNGTVCFRTTVPFFGTTVLFFHNRTKTEQCVFVPLCRFLHHCSILFHNGTKNGTVCFGTTVPFFALLFHFFPKRNKKRNSVFLYHCSVFFAKFSNVYM